MQGAVGLRNRPSTSFKRGLPVCTFLAPSVGLGTSQHLAGPFIGLSSSRCFRALENAAVHPFKKIARRGRRGPSGGLFYFAPALLGVAPKVADALRTGDGVRFEEFGPECVVALDMINTGQYEQRLAATGSQSFLMSPAIAEEAAFSMSVATSAVSEWQ